MVQIKLTEFTSYELPDLLEFIKLQDEHEYSITLPKNTAAFKDDNFNIFLEYYSAAFVGQQLWQISDTFSYAVPCFKKPGQFSFQITTHDKIQLTETLYFLVKGFLSNPDQNFSNQFKIGAARFFEDMLNRKGDIACWALIRLTDLFLAES